MKDEYINKLNTFLNSNLRNEHLQFDNLAVYVRKSTRISPFNNLKLIKFIDIATINVDQNMQHRGICTLFMRTVETLNMPIFVENILNNDLQRFLLKQGYRQHPSYSSDVCLYLFPEI